MDEIVRKAISKWPNVPAVYNWLQLDRRGNWLVKGERIGNAAVVDFIGRNYGADEQGRWFFQNGPQRVFVDLAYTPFIYRLDPNASLGTHTGAQAGELKAAWVDENGEFVLETALGVGLMVDRDLPLLLDHLRGMDGQPADDAALEALVHGERPNLQLRFAAQSVRLGRILSETVPTRFHFDPRPRPAPGEPEC